MATDLTVEIENRPGELARLGEATGGAGVNLMGLSGDADPASRLHVLVDDEAAAREALEAAGIIVINSRRMLIVAPGRWARSPASSPTRAQRRSHLRDVRPQRARLRRRRPRAGGAGARAVGAVARLHQRPSRRTV